MTFDLEKLLLSAVGNTHSGGGGVDEGRGGAREEGEGEEEGSEEEDANRDFGNSSLRRKLFGQPERQVSKLY